MSVPGGLNETLLGNSTQSGTYRISRSLRSRVSNANYMSYSPSPAGNMRKMAFLFWLKNGGMTTGQNTIIGTNSATTHITFSNNQVYIQIAGWAMTSTEFVRDIAAWEPWTFSFDMDNADATKRVRVYRGTREIMAWDIDQRSSMSGDMQFGSANPHYLCKSSSGTYAEAYLADFRWINGATVVPNDWLEIDTITGQLNPKSYSPTYGARGCYLNFADNSSQAALGTDSSGNGNNWSVSGFSVTAGTTNDSLTDTPTNYGTDTGVGGEVRGNYATLLGGGTMVAADGNLKITGAYGADVAAMNTTMAVTSGKWYWEMNCVNIATYPYVGIAKPQPNSSTNYWMNGGWGVRASGASTGTANAACPTGPTEVLTGISFATNDILMFALDMDNKKFFIGKNGTWFNSAVPASGTNPQLTWTEVGAEITPQIYTTSAGGGGLGSYFNFGQRPFGYTAPSGFKCLCTQNFTTPAVVQSETRFLATTYTGNGDNQFIGDSVVVPIYSYQINNSLRFKRASDTYLNKTFSSAGNRQKLTISFWCKRAAVAQTNDAYIFGAGTGASAMNFNFSASTGGADSLVFQDTNATNCFATSLKFRDTQNWHHYVIAFDTTQASSSNRVRVYFDGVELTSFSIDNRTNITLNQNLSLTNNIEHRIGDYSGARTASTYIPDAYLAQFAMVDGQQLTPSTFGQSDANGNWIPKDLSSGITWGTNGFWQTYSNSSSVANLGLDSSGNSNTFTVNNFSVTTGTTFDALLDAPAKWGTDTGAGGEVHGNYITFDAPLRTGTYTEGALNISATGTNGPFFTTMAIPRTGKWYWEFTAISLSGASNSYPGMVDGASKNQVTSAPPGSVFYNKSGLVGGYLINGTSWTGGTYSTYTDGDIIGFAYDADTGKFWCSKNGTWQNSGAPASGTGYVALIPAPTGDGYYAGIAWGAITQNWRLNAGARAFNTAAPSGFKCLCEQNFPADSQIVNTPDLVWIKSRSAATGWVQADSVNGAGKYLSSNSTAIQTTDVNSVVNFNYNGIYIGNASILNTLNSTYVAYMWDKSATCGTDIVSFAGNGGSQTFNHSLGKAPSMMICKNTTGSVQDWIVYHSSIGNTGALSLSTTAGTSTSINWWSNVTPSSTTFSVGANFANSTTYINYLFAEIAGFSKFGKYVGNGSTDGVFVYLGFRPRFILFKADAVADWTVLDAARSPTNTGQASQLFPDLSNAESTGTTFATDFLSNGFKLRDVGGNVGGTTYYYAAFAETPFNYSRAR